MTFEMQQSISLLRDLLWLKNAELGPEDRRAVDLVVDEMLPASLTDTNRLMDDWTREVAARAQRVADAQEQAALDLIAEEEKEARDAMQAGLDAEQRTERLRAGVS